MELDRFDRLVLKFAAPDAARNTATTPTSTALAQARKSDGASGAAPSPRGEVDHITSKRGPRYIDTTTCPLCGGVRVGLEFHGVLLTGDRVHTLAAHSPGYAVVRPGQQRCMAAKARMTFLAGCWVMEQKL